MCGSLPKLLHSSCVHSSPSRPDLPAALAVVIVHLTSFFKTQKNFSTHATSTTCSAATVSKQPPHHTSSCPYKKNLSSLVTVSREKWASPVTQASLGAMEWWSLLAFQKETKELRFVRKMQLWGSRTRIPSIDTVLLNFFSTVSLSTYSIPQACYPGGWRPPRAYCIHPILHAVVNVEGGVCKFFMFGSDFSHMWQIIFCLIFPKILSLIICAYLQWPKRRHFSHTYVWILSNIDNGLNNEIHLKCGSSVKLAFQNTGCIRKLIIAGGRIPR